MEIVKQIESLRAALARVEADHQKATTDVAKNGLEVLVTVLDSHGAPVTKRGLNPACKIITAAERMRKSLARQISSLEDDLRKIEKAQTPNPFAKYAPKERKQRA